MAAAAAVALGLAAFAAAGSERFFPARLALPGIELELNGKGTRALWFVSLYECGLYLPRRMSDPSQILDFDGPVVLRAHIVGGDPDAEVPGRWRRVLREEISDRVYRRFRGLYRDLDKGDRVEMGYRPGVGTWVELNGEVLFRAPNRDLIAAMLRLWVGENAVSASLRRALVGK